MNDIKKVGSVEKEDGIGRCRNNGTNVCKIKITGRERDDDDDDNDDKPRKRNREKEGS